MFLYAGGAVATALVVVFAVAILPARSDAPIAVSSTTMPPFTLAPAASTGEAEPTSRSAAVGVVDAPGDQPIGFGPVTVENALASDRGLALTGAPHAVAAPVGADALVAADADEIVHLVTASHVYHVSIADLDRVIAPDGTVVIADDGRLLGTFADGRFVAD